MAELDICNRCLVNVNSTTAIRARFRDSLESCEVVTDPVALKKWAQTMLCGDVGAVVKIEVNHTTDRFRPVSTWHGDPVCSYHLWVLVDTEARMLGRYGFAVR